MSHPLSVKVHTVRLALMASRSAAPLGQRVTWYATSHDMERIIPIHTCVRRHMLQTNGR